MITKSVELSRSTGLETKEVRAFEEVQTHQKKATVQPAHRVCLLIEFELMRFSMQAMEVRESIVSNLCLPSGHPGNIL